MIEVPAAFVAMPRWWHDEAGRGWLSTLPTLVATQCRRWGLDVDGVPRHGSNALIVPVRRGSDRWVLRLAPPGDDVAQEAAALEFWAGRGTVALAEVDLEARALLLERLGDRTLATEPLPTAIPIVAGLVRQLAVPAPVEAATTTAIARVHVATFPRDWSAQGEPTPRTQLDIAVALAAELGAGPEGSRAANGDLHSDQILAGSRAPWLVVDPVLLRGDPEYDFARVLWSRLDELPDDAAVIEATDAFVREAEVPAERARAWVVVRAMSYLLWGLEHGLTLDPPRCRRLLDVFG